MFPNFGSPQEIRGAQLLEKPCYRALYKFSYICMNVLKTLIIYVYLNYKNILK